MARTNDQIAGEDNIYLEHRGDLLILASLRFLKKAASNETTDEKGIMT